jgi:transposase-like protein
MRKRYTPAQKAAIVLELLREEDTLPKIAARHEMGAFGLFGRSAVDFGLQRKGGRRCQTLKPN